MEVLVTISGTPCDRVYLGEDVKFADMASEILETIQANVIDQSPELKEEKPRSLLSSVKGWIGDLAPPLLYGHPDGIGFSSLKGRWS